jgi:hypothetical protein
VQQVHLSHSGHLVYLASIAVATETAQLCSELQIWIHTSRKVCRILNTNSIAASRYVALAVHHPSQLQPLCQHPESKKAVAGTLDVTPRAPLETGGNMSKQLYGAVSAAVHQRDDAQQAKDHERRLWQSEARWKYMPFVSGTPYCVASARNHCTVSSLHCKGNTQFMLPRA